MIFLWLFQTAPHQFLHLIPLHIHHLHTPPSSPPSTHIASTTNTPSSICFTSKDLSTHIPPLRRSSGTNTIPSYLNQYHCYNVQSHTSHWSNLVTFSRYFPQHKAFLSHTSTLTEPNFYLEASKSYEWQAAMTKEFQSLEDNQTWELTTLPLEKKAIGCKWVYKIKLKAGGTIERYKAWFVAKVYNQKHGIDFDETFSPVVHMSIVRCLIALVASSGWYGVFYN